MSSLTQAFIGLGSNLDAPLEQVTRAVKEIAQLDETEVLAQSHWYRSKPVGPEDQPDYINGAVLVSTALEAHQLLDGLQNIENEHQRVRKIHWGPRTLDLDILLFGQQTIATERLTVPHAYLRERNFVLYPLADICRHLVLPSGEELESLLAHCSSDGLIPIED